MPITRILGRNEIERVREAGGPLAEVPDLSRLTEATIVVVEDAGRIVAYWPIFYALHLEPLWITEDHRKSPSVVKGLLEAVGVVVEASEEPVSFAIIDPDLAESSLPLAERLGFARVPGDLYYVMTPAAEPVRG